MSERRDQDDPGAPEQGMDADVVVSADAGTVSGLGPQRALDEIESEEDEDGATEDAT